MSTLCLQDVNFTYDNRPLLKNVSITIDASPIIGITGNNGSGKSTLLRLIHALIKPQSGQINWQNGWQPKIAMVFQKPLMLRRSVLANIELALKIADNPTDPLYYLALVDLAHLKNAYARNLSGGEQQKLAIARMLALQSDVILLDEPTAHLDIDATFAIEQIILQQSQQGKQVFLVSHDMQQIERLAKVRLHIHQGELKYF
jgi:tungstate transport system ATP-binding protein